MKNALIKLDLKSTLKAAGLYRISMFYYVVLLIKCTICKPVKIWLKSEIQKKKIHKCL